METKNVEFTARYDYARDGVTVVAYPAGWTGEVSAPVADRAIAAGAAKLAKPAGTRNAKKGAPVNKAAAAPAIKTAHGDAE